MANPLAPKGPERLVSLRQGGPPTSSTSSSSGAAPRKFTPNVKMERKKPTADPVAIPLMLQNIKTETQDTRKRVRAFVPKVNTQRTVSYAAGIPASVISPFGAGAAPTREFKTAAVGGPVVQKRRKGQVTAMEDIDPLNRYRPTTLPFIDPKEKLRQQVKKEVVEPKETKFRLDDPVLDKELEDILKLAEEETLTDATAETVQGGEEEEAKAYAEEQDMKKRDITKYFIDNDPTDERLFYVQLPTSLPITPKTPQEPPRKKPPKNPNQPTVDIFEPTVTQVPPGFLGQIVVYKSGKAKIKLGDTLFDIVPGADCGFLQEAAYISKDQGLCCVLGELVDRLSFVPDIDSLLQNQLDLNKD